MSTPSTSDSIRDDDGLLAELGRIAGELDAAPESAFELGRQAFALMRLDEELADLVTDSAVESAGVRAAATAMRLLSFESARVGIDLQLSNGTSGVDILGVVSVDEAEDGCDRIELQGPGASLRYADVDSDGRFMFSGVADPMVRCAVRLGGATVATAWIRL